MAPKITKAQPKYHNSGPYTAPYYFQTEIRRYIITLCEEHFEIVG